jgi:hypothetical protein
VSDECRIRGIAQPPRRGHERAAARSSPVFGQVEDFGLRPRRATTRPPSFSASASVTSSSREPRRASANVIRTVAPRPSGISCPDISDTRIVLRATAIPPYHLEAMTDLTQLRILLRWNSDHRVPRRTVGGQSDAAIAAATAARTFGPQAVTCSRSASSPRSTTARISGA